MELPDTCPTTIAVEQSVRRRLGKAAAEELGPETDRNADLARFLPHREPAHRGHGT